MRHFGGFSNIMEVLETLEKLGKQIVVKWFWELWKACSKVNICCPTLSLVFTLKVRPKVEVWSCVLILVSSGYVLR